MSEKLKQATKRVLPNSIVKSIKKLKHGVRGEDAAIALELKREFFWKAFKALDYNGIDGDYVEFGSHSGKTFRLAYDQIKNRTHDRHMWSFDSFEGLPEQQNKKDSHPKWNKGTLSTGLQDFQKICDAHGIPKSKYTAVAGFYEDSLSKFESNQGPVNIALAYIDCDMYSSTKTVLDFLKNRLKHGMLLAFDDYYCWSSDQLSGEKKALLELINENKSWNFEKYKDIGWGGTSFVVEKADLFV